MSEPTFVFYAVIALAGFVVGVGKGGLGGMAGALSTTMVAQVLPVERVIGLMLPLLLFADIFAVAFHWRRWSWRLVGLLLPGAIVGITLGTWVITAAPTESLKVIVGILVLIFSVYRLLERWLSFSFVYRPHWWHGLLAGTGAGFGSSLAHSGGPFISIYLLMQEVSPPMFAATAALFFAIANVIKVPYYIYASLFDLQLIWQVLWLAPVLPLGVWFGKWGVTRINKAAFEQIILWLLIISAVLLLVR